MYLFVLQIYKRSVLVCEGGGHRVRSICLCVVAFITLLLPHRFNHSVALVSFRDLQLLLFVVFFNYKQNLIMVTSWTIDVID